MTRRECPDVMLYVSFSALMAAALDDFTIKIVDIDIKRVVRQFSVHKNRVTDMVSELS